MIKMDSGTLIDTLPSCTDTAISNNGTTKSNEPASKASSTSSSWGTPASLVGNESVSLRDVMSEELAHQLHQNEIKSAALNKNDDLSDFLVLDDQDTTDDLLLAQMMQLEFDKEYDKILKKTENKHNGQSKVSISLSNYRTTHPFIDDDDSSDDEPYEPTTKSLNERGTPSFNKQGISGKGKNITTKHDATICGRRNASRVMEFPPQFESGDVGADDLKLSNKTYNSLRQHSISEEKRRRKLHEKKEHSTTEMAVDPRTRLILYKLVNSEVLESINGVISTGKESVVFHAYGGSSTTSEVPVPDECAIKVFKTTLNEFRTREQYVHGDYRFSKDEFKKQNPRKIIKMWAEKEALNLRKMRRMNIACPDPVALRKHVLVMSFIGRDQISAPKLKDTVLTDSQWQSAFQQCLQLMKTMHNDCALIHADLSEYNLLWHDGKVWTIDVSQAVDRAHPKAYEFLLRDCTNISNFFMKKVIKYIPDPYNLFNSVTGMCLSGEGREFLAQVQEYEKREEVMATDRSQKEYPFDFFFDKATKQRETEKNLSAETDVLQFDKQ